MIRPGWPVRRRSLPFIAPSMLGKTCVLIVSLGLIGGVLLHLRQARLQVVHELAKTQLRMNERDRDLFRIRARIAQRTTPEQIAELAARLGPMAPLGVDPPAAQSPRPAPAGPGPGRPRSTVRAGNPEHLDAIGEH